MTDEEIFTRLRELIRNVLGVKLDDIRRESVLIGELGAESIDLLDLSYLIEDTFGITIEPNEFEARVTARLPDGVFEREGYLTEAALAELRAALPEVDQARLVKGFRKAQIPSLLTVGVFVRLIKQKIEAK